MSDAERPSYRILDSNTDAKQAIVEVLSSAQQGIAIFDRTPQSLRDREIDRPANIEIMRQMLLGGRHRTVRVALHETQGIESELPRLINLMSQFGQQVSINRVTGSAREVEDVMLIADDHSVWRKPVFSHPRSIVRLEDRIDARAYVERFTEIWEGSERAVSDRQAGL
jgi:hypothetical protein